MAQWASLVAQLAKNQTAKQETLVGFLGWEDLLEKGRDRLPTSVFLGFPCGSGGKESTCNVGDICAYAKRLWVRSLGWEDPLE